MPRAAFNAESLIEEFGDEGLIVELAELLLTHVDDQLGAVSSAIEHGNASALKSAAHKIKGGMGTFGAAPVVALASALESLGREGRLEEAPQLAAQLHEEVTALCDSARAWLASRAA